MTVLQKVPRKVLHLIHLPPQIAYAIGLGLLIGRIVLSLTTTGRKSGRERVTPLQYEEIDGCFYVAAAFGERTDWYRNILVNPRVKIRVKSRRFAGQAQTVTDVEKIADFLAYRLSKHPRMVGMMMRSGGVSMPPQRNDLLEYARRIALVKIDVVNELA